MLSLLMGRYYMNSAALNVSSPHFRHRHRSVRLAAVVVSCAAFQRAADAFAIGVPNHPALVAKHPRSQQYHPSLAFDPPLLAGVGFSQHRQSIHSTSLAARGRSKSSAKSKSSKSKSSSSSSGGGGSTMRGVKKENLPQKVCVVCHRPFTWRKKWEKVWDEVTTCSKSCNRKRREANRKDNRRGRVDGNDDDEDDDGVEVKSHDSGAEKADTASVGSNLSMNENESTAKIIETMGDQIEGLDINSLANDDVGSDNDINNEDDQDIELDPNAQRKAERKAAKKARKAARRAEREGRGDPTAGQKECDMCSKSVDLLVRCKHKESRGEWEMVCGKCWNVASGGVVDGDASHPEYQYGGLWKNRRAQKV